MAGIGKYAKGKKFTLKSGNKPSFKMMASYPLKQGPKHDPKKDSEATADPKKGKEFINKPPTTSEKVQGVISKVKDAATNPKSILNQTLYGPAISATMQAVKHFTKKDKPTKPKREITSKPIKPTKQKTKKTVEKQRGMEIVPRTLKGKKPTKISHNLPEKDIVKKQTVTPTTTKKRRKRKNK